MIDNNDDIEKILSEYKTQRSERENREVKPIDPPKRREELIDFSKPEPAEEVAEPEGEKTKKPERKKKTPEQKAEARARRAEKISIAKKTVFSKKVLAPVIAVLLVALGVFITISAVNYSKTAYLKPYQSAYPDVTFPDGILEKYCDDFGKNPDTQGYLTINGSEPLRIDAKSSEALTDGAIRFNYVIYLDDKSLEKAYKSADLYNKAQKGVLYTDLVNEYCFQIAGAYYTNTDPADDDGYVFPYNTTEKMELQSAKNYIERVNNRLLYRVSGNEIIRTDTLLTISCPTDYKEGYRFVLVCRAVDKIDDNAAATDNPNRRLTDSEYKAQDIVNPYRFASKWLPEIIIIDENGNESIIKKQ